MTGNGRKKVSGGKQAVKENQEKSTAHHVKQSKASTVKAKAKNSKEAAHQTPPPEQQHDKGAQKKSSCKTQQLRSSKKVVHNPLDRIRQMEPQKGSSPQYVYRFTGCLKERNVICQQNNMPPGRSSPQTAPAQMSSQVPLKDPAQTCPKKAGLRAPERTTKKLDSADRATRPGLRRQQQQASSMTPKRVRNVVPLQLTSRNITVPLPFTCDENQASHRTVSRAQALVENIQALQSRLNTPHATAHLQGLSALAPELPALRPTTKSHDTIFTAKSCVMGYNVNVPAGDMEANCLKEDVTRVMMVQDETDSSKPRFIGSKQVPSLKDWKPGSGSQKLLELERQQDRRFAQKSAMRKKDLGYFRRLEGVGRDIDDAANITSAPARDCQSIANFPIREDVEESVQGYAKFLYRPGAAWRTVSSDSGSFSSFGPNLHTVSEGSTFTRPTSHDTKKSTAEIVGALSLANARREAMRTQLAQRLREERVRKKLFLAQERTAAIRSLQQRKPCRCC